MSFEFVFTEQQKSEARRKHGEAVVESLEERLESKRSMLSWIDVPAKLSRRFQSLPRKGDIGFPEVAFKVQGKHYRAFFVLVEEAKKLVFLKIVAKEDRYIGSQQDLMIKSLLKNRIDHLEYAKQQLQGIS